MRDTGKPADEGASRGRLDLVAGAPHESLAAIASGSAALRAALAPSELDAADNEALLALALGADVAEHDAAEQAAAAALRHALTGQQQHPLADWAQSLRCAWGDVTASAVVPLAEADHMALLALALGEAGLPQPSFSDEEKQQAEQLRAALAGEGSDGLADWAAELRHADAPSSLDELSHRRLVKQALAAAAGGMEAAGEMDAAGATVTSTSGGRSMLLAAIVAIAAAVALFAGSVRWLETRPQPSASAPAARAAGVAAMVVSRSTVDLFDPMTPFPAKGGESERIKRIVAARSADLRSNRFAAWGVR